MFILVLEFIAVLSSALFAGAALYIDLVEHPERDVSSAQTRALLV